MPVVQTCPPCSYLWENKCMICGDGDPHPGCLGCVGGKPIPQPWYKSDIVASVIVGSAVAVITGIVVGRVERWIMSKK